MWRTTLQASSKIKCGACSCVSRSVKVPTRCQLCTKTDTPPTPALAPPRRTGRRFLKFFAGSIVVAGGSMVGAVAYARSHPEFRMQVESNWPILLGLSPYLFDDDNNTTSAQNNKAIQELPAFQNTGDSKMFSAILSEENVPVQDQSTGQAVVSNNQVAEENVEGAKPSVEEESRLERLRRQRDEERRAKELHDKMVEQEIEDAADLAAFEAIIISVSTTSSQLTLDAIQAHEKALLLTAEHRDRLKEAMEDSESDPSEKRAQWSRVVEAAEAKIQALRVADDFALAAREELKKLQVIIKDSREKTPRLDSQRSVTDATSQLTQMTYDLDTAIAQVVKAQTESNILKEYHELIQNGKEQFSRELESLMPEVKLGEKGQKLTEDELNSLIAHGHRRIQQLHHQLAELQTMEKMHIEKALERQKEELQQEAVEAVNRELDRQRGIMAVDMLKKTEEVQAEAEKELRVQLRRQAAAHSDHLADVLQQQAKENEQETQRREQTVRIQEQDRYHQTLAGALATLEGVKSAVEGNASVEKQVQNAHELWLACENLQRTINSGAASPAPLAIEITAVTEASEGDAFVQTIIQSVPDVVLLRGVPSQETLRQRWDQVRRVCRRVTLVDETGTGLFTYAVSFIQSLFLFTERFKAPPAEIDPASLDTSKLLDFASYHLAEGDLEQAVRYVNQLRGMPRHVVSDWLREARLVLEASQAASALSAHASASGLGGLKF